MIRYTLMQSPIDEILIAAEGDAIVSLQMATHRQTDRVIDPTWTRDDADAPLRRAAGQLAEYFAGERTTFDLPLAPVGTEFQRRVWDQLCAIPHGTTITYGELARRVGDVNASRAVGLANGRNPIAIVIPCHRVIGANGALTGFGGGVKRKRFLLEHEGSLARDTSLFASA